jgi:hypothetical protein
MDAVVVLVHSPSVGPGTWDPVAECLRARGATVVVPSLAGIGAGGPPFWPRVAAAVSQAMPADRSVVLVAHSNAGLFVPVIVAAATAPVVGCLFVDASLPARQGPTPVVPAEALGFLRDKAVDGILPPWTTWFDEAEVAPMLPDPQVRAAVEAEQPRLPLSYYEQQIPAPEGWDARPCGYLLFGPPYEQVANEAAARGWAVERIPGRHLHQVVDPDGVAERIAGMTGTWSPPSSPAGARA